jgi:hypothetical protein
LCLIEFGKTESLVGRKIVFSVQCLVFSAQFKINKMKNIICTFLILFIGISSSAQEVINADLVINETPTIYVLGGIASVITKEDIAFAKNITYNSMILVV